MTKAKKETGTKKAVKKVLPVEVVCIIDRSSSMWPLHDSVIKGINNFVDDQKKLKGKANLTLVEFDDQYNVIQKRVDLKKAKVITKEDFVPRGSTALNDAIGKTVTEFVDLKNKKKINKAIFVVMTDGFENSSTEFKTKASIKALIEQVQKDHKWEFVYLGANQDAFQEGTSYGFAAASSVNYSFTDVGVNDALRSFSSAATSYRSSK